jgi:hypothetical protein
VRAVQSRQARDTTTNGNEKLAEYKQANGDCNVPYQYESDRKLGLWVSNQRKTYALAKRGKASMCPDRVKKLEEIGFEWSCYESKRRNNK